ncbi:type IV secretory system conjugative DNA transfer family protein [Nocardia vulneris]|uniref:type IV secretory system conjugative DNA transfer family protein n=1 Tax=Nocardia vulneris TaxID=1141657 RepID=UPI000690E22A|nr:TraM recognition domain-containing protein [Nocardia vulneris]
MPAPTPTPPPQGWLEQLLLTPHHILDRFTAQLVAANTATVAVLTCVMVATALSAAIMRLVHRARLGRGARHVVILSPPTLEARAAQALWSHLVGLLRPAWKRLLCGQPHLSFEYKVTGDAGVTLALWVPASVPPGLVERAVASAWPGARTRTLDLAEPPLPTPSPGCRRLLVAGKLRLGRVESLPIRTDYDRADIAREVLTAAADLAAGESVCVQILARPVTGHRVRRVLTGRRGGLTGMLARVVSSAVAELLDLLTPGSSARSPRVRSMPSMDRFSRVEDTTQTRAAVTKTRGGHWETLIRYAAAVELPADTDPQRLRRARAVARGRAHAAAAVFASCTDLNFYRRRRLWRKEWSLQRRWLGRGDLLSVPELAGIAHLPGDAAVVPGLARAGARALPPTTAVLVGGPYAKPLGLADSGSRRPVALAVADARHHTHVLGATGVGKSTLLARWILADADAGRGQVVIDPKGDLVTDVLARLPRRLADKVVLFDADSSARPPCVNPLDTTPEGLDLAVENLATIFSRIYARWWGPRTDDLLRAGLRTLCARPGTVTLVDLARLLTGEANLDRITRDIDDPVLRGFWNGYAELSDAARAQVVGPLLNKLRTFLLRPFVRAAIAAGESTVDLAAVLDEGGICLARLPKGCLGEDTTRLMGSLLVARTWQAVTARTATPISERADASLVLDEAQNFLNLSTPVEDMLAEARGLRLSLVLAHQNLGQLSRELRDGISANARNKIVFSASPEDSRDLARHTSPWLSEHDLTHLDVHHAAARILVTGQQAPPFTFTTQPLPDPTPGRAAEIRAAARTRSRPAPPAPAASILDAPDSDPRLR